MASIQLLRKFAVFQCALLALAPTPASQSSLETSLQVSDSNASWTKYIIAPKSRVVKPVRILVTTGNVSSSDGLLTDDAVTTLTRLTAADSIPSVTLDFGQNIVGIPQIIFSNASSNGPGIRVAFSETVEYLTDRSDFTRSDNADGRTHGTDNFVVPVGRTVWQIQLGCLHGEQVCADGLHGFRYMKIALDALDSDAPYTAADGQVSIESVQVGVTGILGTADTYGGWFECSDETLNRYWYQGSYTNEMTIYNFLFNETEPRQASSPTLEGKLVILDGAKRDRDPYAGDIAVSGRTTYLTHPDAAVAVRNVLADLADHQQQDGYIPPASILDYGLTLFDYTLWWISTSYDYVMYTGDVDYIKTYFPAAVKAIDEWYGNRTIANGLIARGAETGTGSGWGDYAFVNRDGAVTYYNALYVRALKEAAELSRLIGGSSGQAEEWEARAQNVSETLNANNWDSTAGAYLDSPSNSATRHAQDGNAMAVIAGVASSERASSSLTYMHNATYQPYGNAFMDDTSVAEDANVRVYAFISYFELEARFLSGMADSAFEQIDRLYGWMAETDPSSTHWEGIGAGGGKYEGGDTSCAHGWSTGIVSLLVNRVLGGFPTGPGFQTWTIKPNPGNLTWARGVVPTPKGGLDISWSQNGEGFTMNVTVPAGTTGTVMVPTDKHDSNASVGGQQVIDGYIVFQNVTEGSHTFSSGLS